MMITELPYREDSGRLFEAIADQPWAIWLDSGRPAAQQGRYDILVAEPAATLVTWGARSELRRGASVQYSMADPFELLRQALGPRRAALPGLPFAGGAVGYFAYDLARRLERLPRLARDAEGIPDLAVGIYDWALVVDHVERRCLLASHDASRLGRGGWERLCDRFRRPPDPVLRVPLQTSGGLRSNLDRAAYGAAFRRVQAYIQAGDCYQVNLAQRFEAQATGDPWAAYQQLRQLSPAPHAAYLNLPWCQVLSSSPERFLTLQRGEVETRPIKGTRPRDADARCDRALARALLASPKDRAENLMIVDLLRNDLGKCCVPGSVQVPGLFELESYANVHHLVSRITGRLVDRADAVELLVAAFPGGSITGAPKLRAMQIIEELEPHRRGVYCGVIGYLGCDGDMDSAIAIRTLVYSDGRLRAWAGGGLVADSDEEEEYRETYHKASAMLRLLRADGGAGGG